MKGFKMSTYIIAEIGINHNGDIDLAKKLIQESKNCGADAVKFQKRDINLVYDDNTLNQPRKLRGEILFVNKKLD